MAYVARKLLGASLSTRSMRRAPTPSSLGEARDPDHGVVRVDRTFHFSYEDATRFIPIGTTAYAWTHQSAALQEETLSTLGTQCFNKLRMCVFPKSYLFNSNEPPRYPSKDLSKKDGIGLARIRSISAPLRIGSRNLTG